MTRAGGGGLTIDEARSTRFLTPSRGVRVLRETPNLANALRQAALITAPAAAVLSDLDAAAWWELPLPPWIALSEDPSPVSVAVPATHNRQQRSGVRGRRVLLPDDHVTVHRRHRVTTPARTWLDCASLIPVEHLVALGDAVLGQRLATTQELGRITAWAKRRRGVCNARRALPILDGRAESPGESLVRAHLMLAGIRAPACNLDIIIEGQWLARVDLAWPDAKVIVEYDGIVHLENRQRQHDAARRNLLQAFGWLVITFTSADLQRPWTMVHAVKTALDERKPRRVVS